MIEKKILALDMSTKRTGYAIYLSKEQEIEYGAITASSQKLEQRITVMREGILKLIKDYNIDIIIIEDVRLDNISNQTTRALLWLQGCISVAAWEQKHNIVINKIGASSWRKVLGIQQGRGVVREQQKQLDIQYAEAALNIFLTASQDDEADAICILQAYLKDANMLTSTQPRTSPPPIGAEESAF